MEIELTGLVWDEFNVSHIGRHNVAVIEVEEACRNRVYVDMTYDGRLLLVGRTTNDRLISIVIVEIAHHKYYVVTARDSSKGERKKLYDY